jgi:MYXO-CTERM domain-containing protein
VRAAFLVAAGLFAALPLRAQAYVRSRVPSDDPAKPGAELFWCTRSIPFVVNQKGSRSAGAASLTAAAQSFDPWTQPSCTDLKFRDQGTTDRADVGYDQAASDNINLVVWREQSCADAVPSGDSCFTAGGCNNKYDCWEQSAQTIAITTTTFNNKTGQIYDADIELNGFNFVFTTADRPQCANPPPSPANCVATDIRNTLTHEVGHVIGLDHNPELPDCTMYPQASFGDLNKRVLHDDDIQGLCDIYPVGKPTAGCTITVHGGCDCSAQGATPASPFGLGLALLLSLRLARARRRVRLDRLARAR